MHNSLPRCYTTLVWSLVLGFSMAQSGESGSGESGSGSGDAASGESASGSGDSASGGNSEPSPPPPPPELPLHVRSAALALGVCRSCEDVFLKFNPSVFNATEGDVTACHADVERACADCSSTVAGCLTHDTLARTELTTGVLKDSLVTNPDALLSTFFSSCSAPRIPAHPRPWLVGGSLAVADSRVCAVQRATRPIRPRACRRSRGCVWSIGS
jgi:hypothetical protein